MGIYKGPRDGVVRDRADAIDLGNKVQAQAAQRLRAAAETTGKPIGRARPRARQN